MNKICYQQLCYYWLDKDGGIVVTLVRLEQCDIHNLYNFSKLTSLSWSVLYGSSSRRELAQPYLPPFLSPGHAQTGGSKTGFKATIKVDPIM